MTLILCCITKDLGIFGVEFVRALHLTSLPLCMTNLVQWRNFAIFRIQYN